MKDELDQRHEGMSKRRCEYIRGRRIGEPQRRRLGDDLVEYNKFDVSKQCKDCVDLQYVVFVGQAILDHCVRHLTGLAMGREHVP